MMKTETGMPTSWAPCQERARAWLPAEAAITPRLFCVCRGKFGSLKWGERGRKTYLFIGQQQQGITGPTLLEGTSELRELSFEEQVGLAKVGEEVGLEGGREGGREGYSV